MNPTRIHQDIRESPCADVTEVSKAVIGGSLLSVAIDKIEGRF